MATETEKALPAAHVYVVLRQKDDATVSVVGVTAFEDIAYGLQAECTAEEPTSLFWVEFTSVYARRWSDNG